MDTIYHLVMLKSNNLDRAIAAVSAVDGFKAWWTTGTRLSADGQFEFHFSEDYHKKFQRVSDDTHSAAYKCTYGDPEWVGTSLHFQFEAQDGQLILHFKHTGWKEQSIMYARCSYHWALYLKSLDNYLDSGKGDPTQFKIN